MLGSFLLLFYKRKLKISKIFKWVHRYSKLQEEDLLLTLLLTQFFIGMALGGSDDTCCNYVIRVKTTIQGTVTVFSCLHLSAIKLQALVSQQEFIRPSDKQMNQQDWGYHTVFLWIYNTVTAAVGQHAALNSVTFNITLCKQWKRHEDSQVSPKISMSEWQL